ncbi:MAG: hypothetical protein V4717_16575 [Bacteroidota bacterium]
MNKIKRKAFLKMGTLAMLVPFTNGFLLQATPQHRKKDFRFINDLLQKLVSANDTQVAHLIQTTNFKAVNFSRRIGYEFAAFTAAYAAANSKYFQSPLVVSQLEQYLVVLEKAQSPDGTVNIGNLESPPDTAFLLEYLTAAAFLLKKQNAPSLTGVKSRIKNFIVNSAGALTEGGVHTPNHRWVICAALARINNLYPNKKYTDRIEEWLDEGVYNDSDGQYPERSRIYSYVEDNALLTMGRLLNKPALYEPVKKNLETTYYYMDPNGDLVTTDSRRQDQYMNKTIVSYYLLYRHMAIKENNAFFAGVADTIEQLKGFEEEIISRHLIDFMEEPVLLQAMPEAQALPVTYEKLFPKSHLLRIRRGDTTTTLFGGADLPITIASGRSNSPNFFAFRKGKAILKYLRLSTSFFSTGYFYSDGIKKEGNAYVLHRKLDVPYYQPLPKNLRNKAGDYTLSPSIDDRFWNKMAFANRPVSNVKTLLTKVTLEENNGVNKLSFDIGGQAGVAITIELCFLENGKLSGVSSPEEGNSFLENGTGTYEFEGDTINFGPGVLAHKNIKGLEGERYSTHFGTLRTEGMHVYLTGITPFKHTITIT